MDVNKNLKVFFAGKIPEVRGLEVVEFYRYTEGWSCETYRIGLSYSGSSGPITQSFIIRKEPEIGLLGHYDLEKEYRVLHALMDTGMRSPRVYWYEPDPEILGRPFYVMEMVEGEVPVAPMKDEKITLFPDEVERRRLGEDFVTILAHLHRVDWRSRDLDSLGDPGTGIDCALYQVEYWESIIRRNQMIPIPLVTYAVLWLKDHLPAAERVCLLHGDYRTGNYIVRDGHIQAVLDWELAHIGDPMEELAYVIDRGWRSGPPDYLVSHLLPEEEFLRMYEKKSRNQINHGALNFYRVLNAFKAVGMGISSAFVAGKARDLRIAVFHYRSYPFFYVLAKSLGLV